MTETKPRLGLSLSGGGYRAAAFHLGTLRKLHEMGLLERVDVMSTISGGSITGACYNCREGDFNRFYDDLYHGLQTRNVIAQVLKSWLGLRFLVLLLLIAGSVVLLFTCYAAWLLIGWPLLIFVLWKFQFRLFPISKRIEEVYDTFFYKKKTLGQLCHHPVLVIGATNLQTARPFIFSRERMQDSTYEYLDDPVRFRPEHFPVSRAVMASSCVPFAFTPVTIDAAFFEDPSEAKVWHPMLVDGGVYDNQGIHKVMQKGRYACQYVITSDAGAGGTGELTFSNTFSLLLETVNVFMSRIKKAQMMRNVYDNAATAGREIAYFSLGWDVAQCIPGFVRNLEKKQIPQSVIRAHALKPEWISDPQSHGEAIAAHLHERIGFDLIEKPTADERKLAGRVGTNLTPLSKQQADCLIKQAMALTGLQVKLYCPSLLLRDV